MLIMDPLSLFVRIVRRYVLAAYRLYCVDPASAMQYIRTTHALAARQDISCISTNLQISIPVCCATKLIQTAKHATTSVVSNARRDSTIIPPQTAARYARVPVQVASHRQFALLAQAEYFYPTALVAHHALQGISQCSTLL